MPNHVHLVVDVERSDASLYRILQSLKAYTAVKANGILSRSGQFWQHESYDHVVRNDGELERIIQYVAYNPVKAGLCKDWRDWKWTYVKEGLMQLLSDSLNRSTGELKSQHVERIVDSLCETAFRTT